MSTSNNPTTKGILSGIRDAVLGALDFGIDSLRNKSELWRLYYDSPLGSELEKNAQKAAAVSLYKALTHYFPSLKENSKTVVAISRTCLLLMDRSKLMYLYREGRIDATKLYDEMGKRYGATLLAVIRRGEDMLTATIASLLQEAGVPVEATRGALNLFFDKITPSEERCNELVAEGLRQLDRLITKGDEVITRALEPVTSYIRDKVIPWMEKKKEKVKEELKRVFNRR